MMPDWLVAAITAKTGVPPGARYCRARKCRQCRAPVLVGLDGELCSFTAVVDPDPLTPYGEALALLAGRDTYTLRRRAGRFTLTAREVWHIAGGTPGDVVARHHCPALPIPPGAVTTTVLTAPATRPSLGDKPPY